MSLEVKKLLGQAIVQLINGDKQKAAELSTKAHQIWSMEQHLCATVEEILNYKNRGREMA